MAIKQQASAGMDLSLNSDLIARRLLAWFDRCGRELPWRGVRDPYLVWISEIMLQQTQAETVKPYFVRFASRFPAVQDLAAAKIDDVLRMWEGLGYYRRARSIHAAARIIVEELGGVFPRSAGELMKLPGIGRYTAGAIASIAFDERAPIVEGNTIRIYSRLAGSGLDVASPATHRELWRFAEHLLPKNRPGDFNQALMDLGQLVCRVGKPDCELCPVRSLCRGRREGTAPHLPVNSRKMKYEEIGEAAIVATRSGKVLMRQRDENEWWTGLWDFPRVRVVAGEASEAGVRRIAAGVLSQTGLTGEIVDANHEIRHAVTRYRIRLMVYELRNPRGRIDRRSGYVWQATRSLVDLPLSATGRKIAKWLAKSPSI